MSVELPERARSERDRVGWDCDGALSKTLATVMAGVTAIGDGALIYNPDLKAVAVNRIFARFYGVGDGDLAPGMGVHDIWEKIGPVIERFDALTGMRRPDLGKMCLDSIRGLFASDDSFIETVNADGRRHGEGRRVILDGGHLMILIRDITHLVSHATVVGRQRTDMRAVIENIGDGVMLIDPDGSIILLNNQIKELYGVPVEAIGPGDTVDDFNRRSRDIIFADPLEADRRIRERTAFSLGGKPGAVDMAERDLGGGRMVRIARRVLDDGRRLLTCHDISVAVLHERQGQYLTWIVENIDEGVTLIDRDHRLIAYNKRLLELYDIDPAAIRVGEHFINMVEANGDLKLLGPAEREAAITERLGFVMGSERHQLRRLATGRIIEINRQPLNDGRSVATYRDVTEETERRRLLEEARARAEEANSLKTEFVARMSHELRTPMHGVLGMAALLGETPLNERQRGFLDILQASGRHMVQLIDDLLLISTLDAEAVTLNPEPMSPAMLAADCIEMVRHRADEKGLELILELGPGSSLPILADRHRLAQIAVNLLTNGVKFTQEGHVRLSLSMESGEDGCWLKLAVADTGIGIPRARREQIFERFRQLGAGGRTQEGVGLGLAITRSLVDLMSGRIEVGDAQEGGALFTVYVPVSPGAEAGPGQSGRGSEASSSGSEA